MVNWDQVLVQSACFAALLAATLGAFALWLSRSLARSERRLAEIQREFLRTEYARLAGESNLFQDEVRSLVKEVSTMAQVIRETVASEDWSPETHQEALAHFEERLAAVSAEQPNL